MLLGCCNMVYLQHGVGNCCRQNGIHCYPVYSTRLLELTKPKLVLSRNAFVAHNMCAVVLFFVYRLNPDILVRPAAGWNRRRKAVRCHVRQQSGCSTTSQEDAGTPVPALFQACCAPLRGCVWRTVVDHDEGDEPRGRQCLEGELAVPNQVLAGRLEVSSRAGC